MQWFGAVNTAGDRVSHWGNSQRNMTYQFHYVAETISRDNFADGFKIVIYLYLCVFGVVICMLMKM
jgi:hypothetical protein